VDGVSPQSFPPVTGGKAATAGIKQVANPKGRRMNLSTLSTLSTYLPCTESTPAPSEWLKLTFVTIIHKTGICVAFGT
jgi:hypothetical protein